MAAFKENVELSIVFHEAHLFSSSFASINFALEYSDCLYYLTAPSTQDKMILKRWTAKLWIKKTI